MTRDELIEELKKAPRNDEVEIKALVETGCGECNPPWEDVETQYMKIHSISTIGHIVLDCAR